MVSSATSLLGWRPTAVKIMQDTTTVTSNGAKDDHANVRFYKMLEIAYNCAKNGYYETASGMAAQAVDHYDEAFEHK